MGKAEGGQYDGQARLSSPAQQGPSQRPQQQGAKCTNRPTLKILEIATLPWAASTTTSLAQKASAASLTWVKERGSRSEMQCSQLCKICCTDRWN